MQEKRISLLCVLLLAGAACVSKEFKQASEKLAKGPTIRDRYQAAKALGELKDPAAIPELIKYLGDQQPAVREGVIEALAKKGSVAAAPVAAVLRTGSAEARVDAVKILGKIGKPAYDSVAPVLQDANPEAQAAAVRALGVIGDDRAVSQLLPLVGNSNREVRRAVVEALGHFSDPRIFDVVFPLLKDPDLRDVIGDAIGNSGGPARVKLIADSMKDQPVDIRLALITALGRTRSADALPILLDLLRKVTVKDYPFPPDDEKIKEQTEKAMNVLGPTAIPPLLEFLRKDDDIWLGSAATSAVSENLDESTVPLVLNELLSGREDYPATACAIALSSRATVRFNEQPTKFSELCEEGVLTALKSDKPIVRERTASANNHNGTPRVKQALMAAFREKDLAVVKGVYEFFIRQGIPGSEDTLIAALNASDSMLMGQAYLNSGNEKLSKAARAWAPRHGYVVSSSDTPGYLRWGQKMTGE